MKKRYFPIFIDLSEKKIVVVGGGVIATRRVNTLLQFTQSVTVVAPEISEELHEFVEKEQVIWVQAEYNTIACAEIIAEADMVLSATNQPVVNHQVRSDCENIMEKTGRHILVNVADDKSLCDFYFPSIVQQDEITVGINSGGSAPGLVKEMRKRIENMLK